MTPEVLTFSGMNELSPPMMRLPTWRFGYCTSRRRCERSMKTMKTIAPISTARMTTSMKALSCPVLFSDSRLPSVRGRTATIPAKIIIDEPLPMPREVICSPSHIRNSVPPVRVKQVEIRKNGPGCSARPEPCMAAPMPKDWIMPSTTVR